MWIYISIRLYGVVLNLLSTGTTLPLPLCVHASIYRLFRPGRYQQNEP
jgi:hypothetical protein